MGTRITFVALAFVALTLALGGCSKTPTVQDICETIAPAEEVADCVDDLGRAVAECQNAEDVLKCMGDAENEDQTEPCFAQCQPAEGGE